MADLFLQEDARSLLHDKYILLIGDSNMRALYKDIVCLLTKGILIPQKQLQSKGECRYSGDNLVGFKGLKRGNDYTEDRLFKWKEILGEGRIEFSFATRVYRKDFYRKLHTASRPPDVVLINSTLWDLTRWGPKGDAQFKDNLVKLMKLLQRELPSSTLVIWLTALHPSSCKASSALIAKELQFIKKYLPFNVLEANRYAASIVADHGFNVLDVHYYTRLLCHRRRPDGVHYTCTAVRYMTNLVLTHIALAWQVKLPGRVECEDIRRIQEGMNQQSGENPNHRPEDPRKILRAKRRLRVDDETGMNNMMAKAAMDVMREDVIGNAGSDWKCQDEDLQLDKIFGPDY